MKLWIISDLHLEFGQPFLPTPPNGADVLVCAGDVLDKGLLPSLRWLADTIGRQTPTVFVAGNHEFYGGAIREGIRDAREFVARFSNIHFLENEAVDIGGVRFIGGTLWTDFRLPGREPTFAMADAAKGMNDYKRIKFAKLPYQKFKPIHALRKHQETLIFITSELRGNEGRPTVMVTHHAPSIRSVPSWFREDALTACYASQLEGLILDTQPTLWVHGHLHNRVDYMIGETRVVANPRGYPGENTGFDPAFALEIPANPGPDGDLAASALAILDRAPNTDADPGDELPDNDGTQNLRPEKGGPWSNRTKRPDDERD